MQYLDRKETKRHGTDDFPLEHYHVDIKHPRYSMRYHWHREAELLYVIDGNFPLILDGNEVNVSAGELCFISGGVLHGGEPVDCVYECIVFNSISILGQNSSPREYITKVEATIPSGNCKFDLKREGIEDTVKGIFRAAREKEYGWELRITAGLCDFYAFALNAVESYDKTYNPRSLRQVKTAIEYIEANYQNPVTLEELARVAGLSPKYFCRYFKSLTHRTPIDYLNFYRVEKACLLLDEGGFSVTDVAYKCGFNDASYFVRTFKKYKGRPPKQYALKK